MALTCKNTHKNELNILMLLLGAYYKAHAFQCVDIFTKYMIKI